MAKLNLASGKDYREGYINVDNKSMFEGDFKVDIDEDIFWLESHDNMFEEILLCHFAMYLTPEDMKEQVERWYGWLKPEGKLIIETGDLKKICKTILDSTDKHVINGLNGATQLFGWDTTVGHKWAWCEDTLRPILEEVGFKVEVKDGGLHNRPERDFTIIGIK